jgi:predicted short-subunit dehydrogenase-like oxidoreductase (DUF2520 family)
VQGITIVGPGRLGGALCLVLERAGYVIDALVYRSSKRAKLLAGHLASSPVIVRFDKIKALSSSVVIITVQDEEISTTASAIEPYLKPGTIVFHTSGSLSSDVLSSLRERGCPIASLHPLASISDWETGKDRFWGAYFCLEGDLKAVRLGKKIVAAIGGRPFSIAADKKALYHASALTAAGHVTALFDIAVGFMVKARVSRAMARKMLQPLLLSVANNLEVQDSPRALTGTFARADESTMVRHLEVLRSNATDNELEVYLDLALRSIELAKAAGADQQKLKKMRQTIKLAKENLE